MKFALVRLLCLMAFLSLTRPAFALPFLSSNMAITGPSPHAVETAQWVAQKGGNVVDVAVAVGLSLSVTHPYYAALGGGGFALIKMDGPVDALDFREVAPQAASSDFYINKEKEASVTGGAAIGVPGFPAGLWAMHQKYGKLKWSQLFEQPIQLAEKGFRVSGEWHEKTKNSYERFNSGGKKFFFKGLDRKNYLPGELFPQPQLAKALRIFRDKNISGFYQGPVANDIIESTKKEKGVLKLEDLKQYQVRWLKPLETDFNGYHIYLMPPPSSGGVIIKTALQLAEKIDLKKQKLFSVEEFHLLGEILSRSFRSRSLLGDPDFHQNPLEKLLSDDFINQLAKSIDPKKSVALSPLPETFGKESQNTTHFSVMDKDGHAVALTVTLNGNYGSGVVSNQYGIALNNEMDDFTTRPQEANMYGLVQGKANDVQPGKRPLSSMSPTLVAKDNQVVMSIGSPGGPRIISGVFQVLYRHLVNGLNMDEAIQSPRLHHQFLPNILYVDSKKFAPESLEGLKKKNHQVEESWMGRVYGIRKNADGFLETAHDSRGEGAAGGY